MQEAWMTAVRRIRDFDPTVGSFQGWLRGMVAHLLQNHFRQRTRRNGQVSLHEEMAFDAESEKREQALIVAETLTNLPERYEAVLRAKYLEGHSVKEIASDWQESEKAIESLLTRARDAFRRAHSNEDALND